MDDSMKEREVVSSTGLVLLLSAPPPTSSITCFSEYPTTWLLGEAHTSYWWLFSQLPKTSAFPPPVPHQPALGHYSVASPSVITKQQGATIMWRDKGSELGLEWVNEHSFWQELRCGRTRQKSHLGVEAQAS